MSLPASVPTAAAPSERLAKLHDVAALVASLAGARAPLAADLSSIDDAYHAGSTLGRARFDDVANRATTLASAAIEALLACREVSPTALAALADAMENEIAHLETLLTD